MYPVMIVGSIYVALEYWVLLPTLEFYIPTIRFVRPRLAKCDLKQNMCQTRTAYFLSISRVFRAFSSTAENYHSYFGLHSFTSSFGLQAIAEFSRFGEIAIDRHGELLPSTLQDLSISALKL